MRLFTRMELSSPPCTISTKVFLSFSAKLSPLCWRFVGTGTYKGYMAINSKGEKGCESPICLWVTRWLLIFFGSCDAEWVVSSLCRSIWYPPFARSYWFYLIGELRRECMPSECDMSGLWRVRRGRCTGTVDLLICNSRNEDLIMKTRQTSGNYRLLKLSKVQSCSDLCNWIDT